MDCQRCGMTAADGTAHECKPFPGTGRGMPEDYETLPAGYEEISRWSQAEAEIEREALRRGIHPYLLIRQRWAEQKERELAAADARLHRLCEKWGITP
jgi:hypothetical protein